MAPPRLECVAPQRLESETVSVVAVRLWRAERLALAGRKSAPSVLSSRPILLVGRPDIYLSNDQRYIIVVVVRVSETIRWLIFSWPRAYR